MIVPASGSAVGVVVEHERRIADPHGFVPPDGGDLLAADDRFVVLLVEVDGGWVGVGHASTLPDGDRRARESDGALSSE
ncbi:hypothetical protein Q9Q99_01455 [Curtobacterium flaccumfaciens]|nr:hypothetical protein Q9Q99_01455 [Curtobacterium flaccumfaciens]